MFTQKLARLCAERGATFLYGHDIGGLQHSGGQIESVQVTARQTGQSRQLKGDAFVTAMASYTPALLKPLGGEHHDFFRWVAANRAERLWFAHRVRGARRPGDGRPQPPRRHAGRR